MHQAKAPAKCSLCGAEETSSGLFPLVVGVGKVCIADGMVKVECEACGASVKRVTSARLQGRTLCLTDYMKEIEKYRRHIVKTFDEESEPAIAILQRAHSEAPPGYTLLAVRRGRNSTHTWEAEYEKTEVFQMRCS
ncbi:MAG: hypothetical protein JRN18_00125 [Nitrososphaerota archaeon]|nr:hypothetical protein [Nitrososphaerota archaeon]